MPANEALAERVRVAFGRHVEFEEKEDVRWPHFHGSWEDVRQRGTGPNYVPSVRHSTTQCSNVKV
jgi:hypothetical protein